ncbi:diguanylate cyclase domain-containing protein [Metabacillus sp. HB246100]
MTTKTKQLLMIILIMVLNVVVCFTLLKSLLAIIPLLTSMMLWIYFQRLTKYQLELNKSSEQNKKIKEKHHLLEQTITDREKAIQLFDLKIFPLEDKKRLHELEEMIHPSDKTHIQNMLNPPYSKNPFSFDCRLAHENENQQRWAEIRLISSGQSSPYCLVIDITDRKEKEQKYKQMAYYDELTELPNRTMLNSHLRKALSRAKRKNHSISIMFIDLDGFKQVNDTHGHEAGDLLLKEVAIRLNDSVREEDLISRIGGDEFILVFEETSKEEVASISNRILDKMKEPFTLLDHHVKISPSIGISKFPDNANSINELIINADKAMYYAKKQGKNNYQFFTSDLQEQDTNKSFLNKLLEMFQKNERS